MNTSDDDDDWWWLLDEYLPRHSFAFIWYDYFLLSLEKHLVVLPDLTFFIFPYVSASKLQFHWSGINLLVQSIFGLSCLDALRGQWWHRWCIHPTIITLAAVAKYISSDHNKKVIYSKLFVILQGYKLNTSLDK